MDTNNTNVMPEAKPEYAVPEKVYDLKYGYIEPKKLDKKRVRGKVSVLSFIPIIMFVSMYSLVFISQIVIGITTGYDTVKFSVSSGIPTTVYFALNAMVSAVATCLPFFIYAIASKEITMNEVIRTHRVKFSDGILMVLMGVGICLLANFPANWLGDFVEGFGFTVSESSSPSANTLEQILLSVIGVAVIPPIMEEFAFRGVILGTLRRFGDWFAIILSSLIFGFMHMSVTGIPFAIISGFVLGYVYVITGNIWVNIGIHALNNLISVGMDLSNDHLSETAADILNGGIFIGFIVLGIAAIVVLVVKKKLHIRLFRPKMMINGWNKFVCTVINPGFICFMLLCLGYVSLTLFGII
ncbi:MAG: type II CAAX endopeptidase family protein [Clostridia bacterium]|nr:type II CAAX endopeptidase family protein [Clostridia bacterium]